MLHEPHRAGTAEPAAMPAKANELGSQARFVAVPTALMSGIGIFGSVAISSVMVLFCARGNPAAGSVMGTLLVGSCVVALGAFFLAFVRSYATTAFTIAVLQLPVFWLVMSGLQELYFRSPCYA